MGNGPFPLCGATTGRTIPETPIGPKQVLKTVCVAVKIGGVDLFWVFLVCYSVRVGPGKRVPLRKQGYGYFSCSSYAEGTTGRGETGRPDPGLRVVTPRTTTACPSPGPGPRVLTTVTRWGNVSLCGLGQCRFSVVRCFGVWRG